MTDAADALPVILFVDDEATAVKYFQRAIGALAPVITAGSVDDGIRLLDLHADTLAVVISDQRMPGRFGNELLRYARDRYPHMVRILTTAYSEIEYTVEAINEGQIHRYIKKPWEISALRMELKQALEIADLRRERDQLMREKMLVRQKQTISNRIGALNILCNSALGQDAFAPLEAYLGIALKIGVTAPEPDWVLMDYSDLVSAEANRGGIFGKALFESVEALRQRYHDFPAHRALDILAESMQSQVSISNGVATFAETRQLAEFLESPSYATVSDSHAHWLAFLIWLHTRGWILHSRLTAYGIECEISEASQLSPATVQAPLAAWIEQF
jgi:two-component system probable response regulator PhcQ